MLIYSETRYVPTDVNMLVIRGKDEVGYYYIHRSLYDQAVIINDIYGEDFTQLAMALTGKDELREDVELFLESVPSPMNALAPFLLLISKPLEELVDMIGAIHVMSGPVHLRKMLKVPFDMRNTPSFSLSIKEEYQLAWDRFFQNVIPYSDDMLLKGGSRYYRDDEDDHDDDDEDDNDGGLDDEALALAEENGIDTGFAEALGADAFSALMDPNFFADLMSDDDDEDEDEDEEEEDDDAVQEPPKTGLDLLLAGGI